MAITLWKITVEDMSWMSAGSKAYKTFLSKTAKLRVYSYLNQI